MQSKLRSPVFVQVELTSKCNNNCIYCYNFWRASDYNYNRKDMSLTELRYVAEVLGNHDIFWATITGGEPFLRKTELFYFLDCLSKKNIQIMINSNATTLEEDDVKKLQNYSLNTFLVSLISYDDQKHDLISRSPESHKKAIRGLNFLLTYDIKVAVNMVATKLNFKDIYKTGKWLYNNFGIKNFSATPLCPSRIEHSQYELNSNEILESITQLISLKNKSISEVTYACTG